jgi:Ca2+/H+ antiporter, TMEM165/GDT1 family
MMCCGKERGKGFWVLCAILVPIGIAALAFVLGLVVMSLWNGILPGLFGWHSITFWQAIGLLILSRILFGGFKCCHHRGHSHEGMHRWHMSPEEREKMKEEWKNRCCTTEKKE